MPLFNVVLGFDLKVCVGLSHSVVAAGAVASCIYGLIQARIHFAHPLLRRRLIQAVQPEQEHTLAALTGCLCSHLVQRSPTNPHSTLLNFDIALTLIPAMLLGVSFGGLFRQWLLLMHAACVCAPKF